MRVLLRLWFIGSLAAVLLLSPIITSGRSRHLLAQGVCAMTADCGSGCTANLVAGYCVRLAEVNWSGGVPTLIGTVKIGPGFEASCWLCECAYTYTDSNGNARFTRSSDLQCSASVGGVTTAETSKM